MKINDRVAPILNSRALVARLALVLGLSAGAPLVACGGPEGDGQPADDTASEGEADGGDGDGDGDTGDGDGDTGDGDGDTGDGDGDRGDGDGDGDGDTCQAGQMSAQCLSATEVEVCDDGSVSTYDCSALCAQEGLAGGSCGPAGGGNDDCFCDDGGDGDGGDDDGAMGSECNIHNDCDSGYCRIPPGAVDGACAVNDFGASCQDNDECEYGACIGDWESDDYGYCTDACESFSDCPTFWECTELGNAAGKYCVQD